MRAFPVSLPSGQRYWTVLDEDLQVVGVADGYLRHLRFGRDAAESTTKAYAHSIVLFLRWCARSGRSWQAGVEQFALFMRFDRACEGAGLTGISPKTLRHSAGSLALASGASLPTTSRLL